MADVGTIMDNLEKEGKSMVDQLQKITDLAYKMSPEGIAAEEAARKALLKRMNEGKGFAGVSLVQETMDISGPWSVHFCSKNMKLEELNWRTIL